MMMISGTKTFMMVLNKKFCTPCAPLAASAASRFLLIDSILLLKARSNLSAFTTSNVPDQLLFPATTSFPSRSDVSIVQSNVLVPNAWVKRDFSLIFTPTLVPGLTTKFTSGLDLYTLRFCSFRVQERNHVVVIG